MRFTTAAGTGKYCRLGAIVYNDDIIGVMDGKYLVGSVGRKSVSAIRQETRPSFRHPIGGLVFGLVMVLAPVLSILDVFGIGLALASPSRGIGAFCMFFFGAYLLWGVATRKNEPWIVFVLRQGERAFPMNAELSADEAALLERICPGLADGSEPRLERALGFEVLPPKPQVPKEGA